MAKPRFTNKLPNKGVMSMEELLQLIEEFGFKEKPCAPTQEKVEMVPDPMDTILDGQHRRLWITPQRPKEVPQRPIWGKTVFEITKNGKFMGYAKAPNGHHKAGR